jgi:hypothetical protein
MDAGERFRCTNNACRAELRSWCKRISRGAHQDGEGIHPTHQIDTHNRKKGQK